jgi:histidine ammonia-lyase
MNKGSSRHVSVGESALGLPDLKRVADGECSVRLHSTALTRMASAYEIVLRAAAGEEAIYGINTGVGPLKDRRIEPGHTVELQTNLIRSHAAGIGPPFAAREVRAAMLLLANCLAHGNSGIEPGIVQLIVEFLNKDIRPRVPCQGSLGASGDLAPLAHVALTLFGEGEVEYEGKLAAAGDVLRALALRPAVGSPKTGLALVNGTHFLTGVGGLATLLAADLMDAADVAVSMHVDASLSSVRPFGEGVQRLRPHPGQAEVAANVRRMTDGSALNKYHANCNEVQDAYSVRCAPQVHGAARDALRHARGVLETEMNSVTDNPLLIEGEIISAGNFHGEPCALVMDYLSLALVEICNISERRTERLLNPALSRGLPAFLAHEPGVESGLMLAHYTAAAVTSENRSLAHPPSADNIPTGANQEDHVSMGMTSARRLAAIAENALAVLSIELLCAARALRMRRRELDRQPGVGNRAALKIIEQAVPPREGDHSPSPEISKVAELVRSGALTRALQNAIGGPK